MIEFKRKYSMQNGNKVTMKNWMHVQAISSTPCTNVHGVKAIDDAIIKDGKYFERWKLVYEHPDRSIKRGGYIFREVNHGGGINGRHETFKEAIWWALSHNQITVFLEDTKSN